MKTVMVLILNYLNIYQVFTHQVLMRVEAKYKVVIYTFTVQIIDLYIAFQSTGD